MKCVELNSGLLILILVKKTATEKAPYLAPWRQTFASNTLAAFLFKTKTAWNSPQISSVNTIDFKDKFHSPSVSCAPSLQCRCHSLQMTAFIWYQTNEISILREYPCSLLLGKIPFMYIPWNDICFAYLHKTYPPYLYVSQMAMFYSYISLSFAFHSLRHLNRINCQKEWYVLLVYWTYNSVCSFCGRGLICPNTQTLNQIEQL